MELALPLTISQFFAYALTMISVAFVGRLGEEAMAIAVLAASFSNVTGGCRGCVPSCLSWLAGWLAAGCWALARAAGVQTA